MRKLLTALAATLAVLLTGCGDDITSGVVTGKDYRPEKTILVPVSNGKTTTLIPQVKPQCWKLALRNGDETGSVCVSSDTWEHVKVGDWFGERE